jgi:DNA-binding MarR family transcriptional regulator
MGKPRLRSVLYRLIEAGQLARHALLVPLEDRKLEAGDDAVLFLLRNRQGATETDIGGALATSRDALAPRLRRLHHRGLIEPRAIGSALAPGFGLTREGELLRRSLEENWDRLEDALIGELSRKRRKSLRGMLERFVALLDLEVKSGP